MIAARVDATCDYTAADLTGPTALVLGSEATGLSAAWHAPDVKGVRIPMLGQADSLNVSVTAAVLFYEALRRHGRHARPVSRPPFWRAKDNYSSVTHPSLALFTFLMYL